MTVLTQRNARGCHAAIAGATMSFLDGDGAQRRVIALRATERAYHGIVTNRH
jgi:hypothetical protein